MRYLLSFFLIVLAIASCNRSFYKQSNVPREGKYFNKTDIVYVFLKIENNVAYIDVMRFTKAPEYYYTDTITIYNNENRRWHGELVTLYERNKKLIIEAPTLDFYGNIDRNKTVNIVVRLNEKKYDGSYNLYKNQTLFHKARSLFSSSDVKSGEIYRDLLSKHQMSKKRVELKHPDFIIQFEEFEIELIKELQFLK
jgi:hypothetical protein